jgi:hypothetical protein
MKIIREIILVMRMRLFLYTFNVPQNAQFKAFFVSGRSIYLQADRWFIIPDGLDWSLTKIIFREDL